MTTNTPDREIVSQRVFNFPRERVFGAWTDPKLLAQWWGPKGFRNTFQEFDLRPGGHWRFIMHGPDSKDYPNHSVFVEIVPNERIVFDHEAPPFRVVATFAAQGDKTAVVFRMIFESAELCAKIKVFAVDANEENFDRLEALLTRTN
jgi:uncharacterized protein YndB with AHSA1/START domain